MKHTHGKAPQQIMQRNVQADAAYRAHCRRNYRAYSAAYDVERQHRTGAEIQTAPGIGRGEFATRWSTRYADRTRPAQSLMRRGSWGAHRRDLPRLACRFHVPNAWWGAKGTERRAYHNKATAQFSEIRRASKTVAYYCLSAIQCLIQRLTGGTISGSSSEEIEDQEAC